MKNVRNFSIIAHMITGNQPYPIDLFKTVAAFLIEMQSQVLDSMVRKRRGITIKAQV